MKTFAFAKAKGGEGGVGIVCRMLEENQDEEEEATVSDTAEVEEKIPLSMDLMRSLMSLERLLMTALCG